jgi:hypothetical protein
MPSVNRLLKSNLPLHAGGCCASLKAHILLVRTGKKDSSFFMSIDKRKDSIMVPGAVGGRPSARRNDPPPRALSLYTSLCHCKGRQG